MSNSENSKLMATAAGAAIAGAALAVAAMKMTASKEETFTSLQKNLSFIYEDKESSSDLVGGGSKLLFPHNHEEKMRRKIATRAIVEEENLAPRRSVTVRVPATSANMGPGCEYIITFYYRCILVHAFIYSNRLDSQETMN
jgi:homoserine kinase